MRVVLERGQHLPIGSPTRSSLDKQLAYVMLGLVFTAFGKAFI